MICDSSDLSIQDRTYELLSRLDNVQEESPGQWNARCPAHDDRRNSLAISSTETGKLLIHCHAGCTKDSPKSVLDALGLNILHLFPDQPKAPKSVRRKRPRETEAGQWIYRDETGTVLFRVVRLETGELNSNGKLSKRFSQQPPDSNGGWIIKKGAMKGVRTVPYRLPELMGSSGIILIAEGEKHCDRLAQLGFTATCNAGGAGKWTSHHSEFLRGRDVVIFPDNDEPGRQHARGVAESLKDIATSVRIAVLPGLPEKGDIVDFLNAGGTKEQIQSAIDDAKPLEDVFPDIAKPSRPAVVLPGKGVEISQAAAELGKLLGATGTWFRRGSAVLNLSMDDEGQPTLRQCRPASLPSAFETVAELKVLREGEDGPIAVPAICSEQAAKLIMHANSFLESLPAIRILAQSPVLVESNGELVEVIGYHRESGVLAYGSPTEAVPLPEAVSLLKTLVRDFKFSTNSDESRAIAAFITPALIQGGLLRGRSPIDLGEADQSQTGKGYRNKITAAIYRQSVTTVTQKSGGVGSLEESLNSALVKGANFIALDNVRGKIDSPAIESMLTEDVYSARVPHAAAVEVDPRRVIIMMTSNKAQVTDDLANRSSCVRLLKQDERYQFQHFPEGDILEHVRANQPKYLGAVFAIIREWHRQGKPRSTETRHDFRPWAQTLDWIVQNIMGCSPLLDGHQAAQERMTNPTLSWLRDVGLRVCQSGHEGQWIRTNKILDILIDAGDVEIPGVKRDQDIEDESVRSTAIRQIGIKLGRCFKKDQFIDIDNIQIDRIETEDDQYRKRYDYKFSVTPAVPRNGPAVTPAVNPDTPAIPAVNPINNVGNSNSVDTPPYIESNAITAGVAGCCGVRSLTRGFDGLKTIENAVCPTCGFDSDLPGKECAACRKSN